MQSSRAFRAFELSVAVRALEGICAYGHLLSVFALGAPDFRRFLAGLLDLALDFPVCLHTGHHRVYRRGGGRGVWCGLDPVEHGGQLRMQLGALFGDPSVLAVSLK